MESYLAFVLATTVILIIPGPTIILVVSQSVAHGKASVVPLVIGVLLGDFTAMTLSFLGLGALLTTSALLFSIFKWIGAIYLVYLGIKMWRTTPVDAPSQSALRSCSSWHLLKSSLVVTALNPKSIAFFVAFLPQFIDPSRPAMAQMPLLGGTFLALATLNAAIYALFASKLNDRLKQGRVRKAFNRCGGTALIGAGIFTASMQRSA